MFKRKITMIKENNKTYSPKKTNKNKDKANSVLKPETNSDSPSIKSKGTRDESEIKQKKRIKITGRIKKLI